HAFFPPTKSTRPPSETSPFSVCFVPAKTVNAPSASSNDGIAIFFLQLLTGYPFAANTTPTHESVSHSKCGSTPSITSSITCKRSFFNKGKTTWVSGSPNRVLNSITFVPLSVIINPAYKIPVNGLPSSTNPSAVRSRISFVVKENISSVTSGTGAQAPIPPVLGPSSLLKARL